MDKMETTALDFASGRPEDMALALGASKLHEARKFFYAAAKQYHDTFKDLKTGLFRDEFLETRSCPVCGADRSRALFVADGGTYVKCGACGMCYLSPVFTDRALAEFYAQNNTAQGEVVHNEGEFYRRIYGKGLAALMRSAKTGSILDVGCSTGFFLDIARESGWATWGVELNRKEVLVAMNKGHRAYNQHLELVEFPESFEAITLWDVFEHIKDGAKYLKSLKPLLAKNGVLFMQIPNFGALAARTLQEKCKMFDGLEHVNLYSPATIRRLAESNGFEILHLETVISEIPVVANYLDFEDPYFGNVNHGGKIMNLIDEEALHRALMGYKMQIVMRRLG